MRAVRDLALNDDVSLRVSGAMESRDARSRLRTASGCVIPRGMLNESLPAAHHRLEMTHSCAGAPRPAFGRVELPRRVLK
jgi:hypothetical protein